MIGVATDLLNLAWSPHSVVIVCLEIDCSHRGYLVYGTFSRQSKSLSRRRNRRTGRQIWLAFCFRFSGNRYAS
jgi:hypothetical protein